MKSIRPELFSFQDDGLIPNSRYPLLLYRGGFPDPGEQAAAGLETLFAAHDWTNSWRNGVYPFHHYHSTSHEVLGVYRGQAELQLGGEKGGAVRVQAGDILVIPAGVGHKNLHSSGDFGVVGAYPEGRDWDLNKGLPGERPAADRRIQALPVPATDPLLGAAEGLCKIWKKLEWAEGIAG